MESRIVNLILGFLSVLSFIWSFLSEQHRLIAIVIGFVFLMIIITSEKNIKIQEITEEQKRLGEKLKIHEQLIDIKADIRVLQKRVR